MDAITDYFESAAGVSQVDEIANGWSFKLNGFFVIITTTPTLTVAVTYEPNEVRIGPFVFWEPVDSEKVGFETERDVVEALRSLASYKY